MRGITEQKTVKTRVRRAQAVYPYVCIYLNLKKASKDQTSSTSIVAVSA